MSYEIGTATNAADLLNKLNTFLTTTGKAFDPEFVGAGNGTISLWNGGATSVAETFTITATSPTSFSVVGSTSGNIGTATVGTQFTHAKLTFMLTAGGSAFVAGDYFKINTSAKWTALRSVAGDEMIWESMGNGGDRSIIVGAKMFSDSGADYYNWRLQGMVGFTSGNTFINQPGRTGSVGNPIVTLWNTTIPYWFVANGSRVIMFAKIGVMYACAHLGLIKSYVSPGEQPYPLLIGGNMSFSIEPAAGNSSWRYSNNTNDIHAFWRGGCDGSSYQSHLRNSCRLRLPDGAWTGFVCYNTTQTSTLGRPGNVWPYAGDGTENGDTANLKSLRENLDGTYPLLPIFFNSDNGQVAGANPNTWGELDSLFATSGHANSSENTIRSGLLTHVVFQDTWRSAKNCYCALALN